MSYRPTIPDLKLAAEEAYWGAKTDDPDEDCQKHFEEMTKVSEWVTENASLIAAAPDLLDACKSIQKCLDDGLLVRDISGDDRSDWGVRQLPLVMVVKNLVDSIDKAEGTK